MKRYNTNKYAYVVYAEDVKFDDPDIHLFWCEDGSAEVMKKSEADHFTYEEGLELEKMRGKHTWKMERVPHYSSAAVNSACGGRKRVHASRAYRLQTDGFIEPRYITNRIIQLLEDGILDPISLAKELLDYLPEDDVVDFAVANGYNEYWTEDVDD